MNQTSAIKLNKSSKPSDNCQVEAESVKHGRDLFGRGEREGMGVIFVCLAGMGGIDIEAFEAEIEYLGIPKT